MPNFVAKYECIIFNLNTIIEIENKYEQSYIFLRF